MKIAIISDVHNNTVNLKKVLDYCAQNKVEKMICCGDLASLETLDYLNDNFTLGSPTSKIREVGLHNIYFVFGNMDNDFLKNYFFLNNEFKGTTIFKEVGEARFEVGPRTGRGPTSVSIAFTHFPRIAKGLCRTGKYDFVFYGHTHKPWTEKCELPASAKASARRGTMLNPGNVAGEIYPATFAVWNTSDDKFELTRVDQLK